MFVNGLSRKSGQESGQLVAAIHDEHDEDYGLMFCLKSFTFYQVG